MRKLCYSVAMSLDGYISGPNGEIDWILMDPEIDFVAMYQRFDIALMGRITFELVCSQGPAGEMPGVRTVVVSKSLRLQEYPGITIIADNLGSEVARMKAESGKDIWLFGGGVLFRGLLEMGLVDTVEVAIIPVLLGAGIPMLPGGTRQAHLQLTRSHVYSKTGIVSLDYVVREAGKFSATGGKPTE